MDDELWGNAWGSTTDTKATTTKDSVSPNLTPKWPAKAVPTPGLSDGWGASPWGASTTNVNLNDSEGGWGDSLEYDNQAPQPVESYTESVVVLEPKEESEPELEQEVYLSSVDHQADIPHSPLPTSPPPESHTTTTDSRSSSPVHRFSTDEPAQEPPVTPRVTEVVVQPSPPQPDLDDNFGGFRTGDESQLRVTTNPEEDPWSPAAGDLTFPTTIHDSSQVEAEPVADGDAWGSNWEPKQEKQEKPLDEWEQARIKKERRDRRVPPEVLSGYLTNWESVVSEIYPDAPLPRSEPTTDWRSPIEEISELQILRKLYRLPMLATTLSSPPPVLAPLPPYNSLQIHSRERAALKATRVSAVSQLSPFAHLTSARSIQAVHRFSSKPSVSISKSSLDFGDGVVGVGWAWAHDEKKSESKPKSAPIPAPVTTTSTTTVVSSTPSPTPATPTGRFSGFWARARGSTDKSSVGQGSRSNTPVPLTSPSTSSLGEATNSTKPIETSAVETSSASTQPQPVESPTPPPASSGVSRFFKRFSRSNLAESERSRLAASESVSLSAEDLEFLADSVPETTEKSLLGGATEIDALEAMLRSKPLPKNVPALAPPPRMTGPSSGSPSPLASVPEGHSAGVDDLWDIFGGSSNGHSSNPSLPAPHRASLTPKLTTPVSSAPGSRSHTPRLPSIADISTIVGGKGSHLRQTSFSGRPQQAFHADVPSLDSPPIPALPPPPGSMAAPSLMEVDPFDDFVSAPSGLSDQAQSRVSFDDFGDFESSAPVSVQASNISSPPPLTISSPPVTISSITSPPPITFSSPPPPLPPPKTGTPVFVRTSTNIQRVGTPPVALPPLLPPPGRSNSSMTNASFTATSAPVIAPPPNPLPQPQIDLFDFGSSPPKNVSVPTPSFAQTSKPTTTAPSKGGLSASDLSFFEGL
ncbi:unnamed protein product [Rhizoctonia solani]|uniref:Uncharacterized protein n=1 Tax=Rhizoctonia solani TaxID=456999 RepID=A0A8H7H6G6_9AGAM|nr:hypothetical protein RHS04_05720 [Rhizoctonia solani]CAE6455394.1 unnamed protein product [Rhizoctonia solani]